MDIEFHEIANVFPLMAGRDFEELAKDISRFGLRHPITIFENKILDGRNRYRACLTVVVDPTFVQFEGDWDEAIQFVKSENLARRHLTPSQLGMCGARLANLRHGGDRMSKVPRGTLLEPSITLDEAAEMLGTSRGSVARGKRVLSRGTPELVRAVDQGEVTVTTAASLANLPPDQQVQAVVGGPGAVRAVLKDHRDGLIHDEVTSLVEEVMADAPEQRVVRSGLASAKDQRHALDNAISALRGLALGLSQISSIHPDITAQEARTWASQYNQATRLISPVFSLLKKRIDGPQV